MKQYINTVIHGDCRNELKKLPDDFIQCCVSSPPYYGLRDYEEGNWEGGDPNCKHIRASKNTTKTGRSREEIPIGDAIFKSECKICGAKRTSEQIGLEGTIEEYLEEILKVYDEVRRVLRPDGVCWLNIGDSYYGSGNSGGDGLSTDYYSREGLPMKKSESIKLKPLDTCLIPERLIIGLQERGWYVRMGIIWNKPNPTPESVRGTRWEKHRVKSEAENELIKCQGCEKCDSNGGYVLIQGSWRPTKAHEFIFMLTKSDTHYTDQLTELSRDEESYAGRRKRNSPTTNKYATIGSMTDNTYKREGKKYPYRNKRSVWTINTQSRSEEHFAAFPDEIPRLCIQASTSDFGHCIKCGQAWARVLEQNPDTGEYKTIDWRPQCHCFAKTEIQTKPDKLVQPAIVLDPFAGRGTTLEVAKKMGRYYLGVELSEKYVKELCQPMLINTMPLFDQVPAD